MKVKHWLKNRKPCLPDLGDIVLYDGLTEVMIVGACVNGFYVRGLEENSPEFRATYDRLFPKPEAIESPEDDLLKEFKESIEK